ncbi:hypothetical protein FOA52_008585 [Chlamydomonas sp. UWO 241]|nr:hypothetical protein FOA52_008585 [Chlamydomonas sp. UWO 241]
MSFGIIAHRGNSALAPENTLPAFELALETTPAFELDTQLSSDGVVVVLHDESLGRINNGTGPAADATWDTLSKLDAVTWFGAADGHFAGARIPTLAEVLARFRGRAHIHLELKSRQVGLAAAVAGELERSGWLSDLDPLQQQQQQQQAQQQQQQAQQASSSSPRPCAGHDGQAAAAPAAATAAGEELVRAPGLTVTSFHLEQLARSIAALPGHIRHGWLVQEMTGEVVEQALAAGVAQLCPRADTCTREAVDAARAAGIACVRGWGVRTHELLRHAAGVGMDGATVNWPHEAAGALAGLGAAPES